MKLWCRIIGQLTSILQAIKKDLMQMRTQMSLRSTSIIRVEWIHRGTNSKLAKRIFPSKWFSMSTMIWWKFIRLIWARTHQSVQCQSPNCKMNKVDCRETNHRWDTLRIKLFKFLHLMYAQDKRSNNSRKSSRKSKGWRGLWWKQKP